MQFSKAMFLGAGASIVAVSGAAAADLPMTKASPVEYVKVCSDFGTGFFYIPGTDTCLAIGGYMRADFGDTEQTHLSGGRSKDNVDFLGRAQIRFDARTATDYGTLRSFVALDSNFDGAAKLAGSNSLTTLHYAYIQFAGLTAGYAASLFNFYDDLFGTPVFAKHSGEQNRRVILTYTATFGKLAVSAGVEDARTHETVIAGATGYAGQAMPDIVAQVRYDDGKNGWGKAQLVGAIHQIRALDNAYDTEYGYAVGGALNVNLPIAAGAYFAIEAEYANGATQYTGGKILAPSIPALGVPGTAPDAFAVGGDLHKATSWSVEGEAGINLTPTIELLGFGSYQNYNAPNVVAASNDYKAYVVGTDLIYTVVKGMTVAGEVAYQDSNASGPGNDIQSWMGGVRIRRNF